MRKTSVYLSDRDVARLTRLAELEGISQAEVLRRAIWGYEPKNAGDRDFALFDSGEGPGGSIADVAEEELLEGFGS